MENLEFVALEVKLFEKSFHLYGTFRSSACQGSVGRNEMHELKDKLR